MSEFLEFPKIARLSRPCVITEKIDGTNAQVYIVPFDMSGPDSGYVLADRDARDGEATGFSMFARSRNRYLSIASDNFGFAAWVKANAEALWGLGEGRHFGEWWGSGIQRGYGLQKGEKRFSLFNASRWHEPGKEPFATQGGDPRQPPKLSTEAPAICRVVPVLYVGDFDTAYINATLTALAAEGSAAAPGFMKPEGIVIWHKAAGVTFKKTLEKDEEPKGGR